MMTNSNLVDCMTGRSAGFAPYEETPEAASALLKREIKLWGDVIRANHIATQ